MNRIPPSQLMKLHPYDSTLLSSNLGIKGQTAVATIRVGDKLFMMSFHYPPWILASLFTCAHFGRR